MVFKLLGLDEAGAVLPELAAAEGVTVEALADYYIRFETPNCLLVRGPTGRRFYTCKDGSLVRDTELEAILAAHKGECKHASFDQDR